MLKMRLQRRGKRNFATYRVVVAEAGSPIKGKFVADVGHYNPHTDTFEVKKDEVEKWLGNGVKASATVHNLLVENKVIKGEKVTSWTPKKKTEEESEEGAEKTEAAAGEATEEAPEAKEEPQQADKNEAEEKTEDSNT